ncbi:MAG TPA: lysophospholipid acyltransferase family protein [Actinomycetota bacterium]|nr:lysophospholipid acyltransferase family protein [Actinomycetota bacterium]
MRVEGTETFPKEGPVIVVANHVSFWDSFFVPLCVPRRVVFLAKAEYWDSWKTRWLVSSLGMIPIKRDVRAKSLAALETGIEFLKSGGVLGVYPEGTRSPDGRLYRGRTGVARLALGSGSPVVPIGLIGSREMMPKGAKFPKLRGRVTVKFGPPMTFEKYADTENPRQALRAMTDEIMFAIMNQSGQTYVDEYASREAAPKPTADDMRIPSEEQLG